VLVGGYRGIDGVLGIYLFPMISWWVPLRGVDVSDSVSVSVLLLYLGNFFDSFLCMSCLI
jgi:hypothetical protein